MPLFEPQHQAPLASIVDYISGNNKFSRRWKG